MITVVIIYDFLLFQNCFILYSIWVVQPLYVLNIFITSIYNWSAVTINRNPYIGLSDQSLTVYLVRPKMKILNEQWPSRSGSQGQRVPQLLMTSKSNILMRVAAYQLLLIYKNLVRPS